VAVQEVKWDSGGSHPACDYTFFFRNMNTNHHFGTGCFVQKGIGLTVEDKIC